MTSARGRLKISRFTTQIVIPSEHLECMPNPHGDLWVFLVLLRVISGVHPGCSRGGSYGNKKCFVMLGRNKQQWLCCYRSRWLQSGSLWCVKHVPGDTEFRLSLSLQHETLHCLGDWDSVGTMRNPEEIPQQILESSSSSSSSTIMMIIIHIIIILLILQPWDPCSNNDQLRSHNSSTFLSLLPLE